MLKLINYTYTAICPVQMQGSGGQFLWLTLSIYLVTGLIR